MEKRLGFTLVEMMVVIAIIAAMVIAIPAFLQWFRQQGVHHAVDQLRADLQLARMMAISKKQTCAIRFNTPGPNQYSNSLTNQAVNLSSYRGGVRFLAQGPNNNPMSPRINFTRRGMAVPAADVYLTDQDNLSIYRILVLVPGSISVYRWNGHGWQ